MCTVDDLSPDDLTKVCNRMSRALVDQVMSSHVDVPILEEIGGDNFQELMNDCILLIYCMGVVGDQMGVKNAGEGGLEHLERAHALRNVIRRAIGLDVRNDLLGVN